VRDTLAGLKKVDTPLSVLVRRVVTPILAMVVVAAAG
jgi:hypothetical protein